MRKIPKPETLFSPEVLTELQVALNEIGPIQPWFDKDCQEWVFEHPLYPESYGGESPEEVIAGYPLYLGKLIQYRMDGTLAPFVEKQIKGRGGARPGAGRPRGSKNSPSKAIRLPLEIVDWLQADVTHLDQVRKLMSKKRA